MRNEAFFQKLGKHARGGLVAVAAVASAFTMMPLSSASAFPGNSAVNAQGTGTDITDVQYRGRRGGYGRRAYGGRGYGRGYGYGYGRGYNRGYGYGGRGVGAAVGAGLAGAAIGAAVGGAAAGGY